jgi:hypothetical protein
VQTSKFLFSKGSQHVQNKALYASMAKDSILCILSWKGLKMMTSKKLSNSPLFLHLLMEKMLGICCKALIYSNLLFMVKTQFSVNGLLVFCVWGDLSPWCGSRISSFVFWDSKVGMKYMSWFCVFWTWILVVCKWVFMKHKWCNIVDGIIIDFVKICIRKKL